MGSKVKIGSFISVCDKRNKSQMNLPVYGINKENEFMPTVANMTDVDTSKYKFLTKGVFAFNGMHVGRDIAVPIGKYDKPFDALISPAYTTFTIDKTKGILEEYFEVFIRLDEFDRLAWFYCDSSVRGGLEWKRFLDIEIPLLSPEEQQKVVNVWKACREIKEQNEAKAAPLMQLCQSYIQELKHKYPAQEIGPYIEECNERNYTLQSKNVRGVSTEKEFRVPQSRVDFEKLDNYKVVYKNQFVFVPTTDTWRCLAICLNKETTPIVVSPIYCAFSVDENVIIPEYLHLYCRRKEVDRYARFHSWGSARENFNFSDMQRMAIPLPPPDVQRAIVNIYKCANEAKQIAEEADKLSRAVCPALLQHVINQT